LIFLFSTSTHQNQHCILYKPAYPTVFAGLYESYQLNAPYPYPEEEARGKQKIRKNGLILAYYLL